MSTYGQNGYFWFIFSLWGHEGFLKLQCLFSFQVGLGSILVSSPSRTLQYRHNCFAVFISMSFAVDAMTLY